MVKCAKKLLNPLTKWVNMQKRVASSRRQSFGVVCVRVLHQFSVSPRIHAPILPDKLQKITKCFQCGYKTKTNWNTERIMQFFKIATYVQIVWLYGLVHYVACAFCHIYKRLVVLRLWVWLIRLFYAVLVCMGIECVRAWACLTGLCICKCRCKIYYTL